MLEHGPIAAQCRGDAQSLAVANVLGPAHFPELLSGIPGVRVGWGSLSFSELFEVLMKASVFQAFL